MIEKILKSHGLISIFEKIRAGERISVEEGEVLFECRDPLAIGVLAHYARMRLHGDKTTYVLNQHINYTNVCVNRCRFCAFHRRKGEEGAFELSLEEIEEKLSKMKGHIREVHIVGGCHPSHPISYYVGLIKKVRNLLPEATIKCFTAVEIEHIAKKSGISVEETLLLLKEAGMEMLPGGGAEIFDPEIRKKICPEKISGARWLEIMEMAHSLGLKSNCTMLFGHIESPIHRLRHLDELRKLQDRTGGFVCFIPLPFLTKHSRLKGTRTLSGAEKLKTIAISRIMLDNIPHIKSYWIMLGIKMAQTALFFGANDFDGTVVEEKIGHMAGADSPQVLSREEIKTMIIKCGLKPVERNGLFEYV